MAFDPLFADAISSIESGGKYDALGPRTKTGDQAYGKYQVMGANIPQWTKEILGVEMTPQQFIASPEAQDAVFQGKFGQYVEKYGPEGAAQAWFAGPGGVGKTDRKDVLGTSVGAYGQKFMAALGQPQGQPPSAQPAPAYNAIPPQTAPGNIPAFSWSPQQVAPQAPQAAPQQNQIADLMQTQMPDPLSHQIGMALRRPPDLSKLQAFLQQTQAPAPGFRFSRTS